MTGPRDDPDCEVCGERYSGPSVTRPKLEAYREYVRDSVGSESPALACRAVTCADDAIAELETLLEQAEAALEALRDPAIERLRALQVELIENGGCPACLAGDEDDHQPGCELGQAEADLIQMTGWRNDLMEKEIAAHNRAKRSEAENAELRSRLQEQRDWQGDAERNRERMLDAEIELDALDSYNGHLAWMDKHYPLDVPYFAESEDVGCQVMRLSRKVMETERMLDEAFRHCQGLTTAVHGWRRLDKDQWLADLRRRASDGPGEEE